MLETSARRRYWHCAPFEIPVAFGATATCLHPRPRCDDYRGCELEAMARSPYCSVHTLETCLDLLAEEDYDVRMAARVAVVSYLSANGQVSLGTDPQTGEANAWVTFNGRRSGYTAADPWEALEGALRSAIERSKENR